MPFDATTSDYLKTKPVPVAPPLYTKDNPPPTMAEAIRMAVADVEAQERAGVEYNWGDCSRCTAGAVCRGLGAKDSSNWGQFGPRWFGVLACLSYLTLGHVTTVNLPDHFGSFRKEWNQAKFGAMPSIRYALTPYRTNPTAFKRDMLALADRLEAEGV